MRGLSPAEIAKLLNVPENQPTRAEIARANGFDPGFLFLLNSEPDNLFEPTSSELRLVCKACRTVVNRWNRTEHFRNHKRAIYGTG